MRAREDRTDMTFGLRTKLVGLLILVALIPLIAALLIIAVGGEAT